MKEEPRGVCASLSAASPRRRSWRGVVVDASVREDEEGGENITEAVHISLFTHQLLVDSLFFPPTCLPHMRSVQVAADLRYAIALAANARAK